MSTNVTLTFKVPWTTKEEYKHNLAKELRKMADIIEMEAE